MSDKNSAVRTVQAIGLVKTDFDWVAFSITIRGHGSNSPEAKKDARPHVDAIQKTVEQLKKEHGVTIDPESFRLSFSVDPKVNYDRGQQTHDGYVATYDISFRTADLDKASIIMDLLTEVEKAQVDAPNFHHDNPESVYADAVQNARRNAERKFAEECNALGLSSDDFELVCWNIHEGARGGMHGKAQAIATAAMTVEAAPEPVELEAGKAEISVTLSMSYAPKTTTTLANRKPQPPPDLGDRPKNGSQEASAS